MRGIVFLDRDGTINEEVEYLHRVEDLQLIPNAAKAIKALNHAGFKVFVVTNQSAIARGILTETELGKIHETLRKMLEKEGAHVDGWFYCPHHPEAGSGPFAQKCSCRKPNVGMIEQALSQLNHQPKNKFVIGDSLVDIQLALNSKAVPILVKTGHGLSTLKALDQPIKKRVGYIAEDLFDAAKWILKKGANSSFRAIP